MTSFYLMRVFVLFFVVSGVCLETGAAVPVDENYPELTADENDLINRINAKTRNYLDLTQERPNAGESVMKIEFDSNSVHGLGTTSGSYPEKNPDVIRAALCLPPNDQLDCRNSDGAMNDEFFLDAYIQDIIFRAHDGFFPGGIQGPQSPRRHACFDVFNRFKTSEYATGIVIERPKEIFISLFRVIAAARAKDPSGGIFSSFSFVGRSTFEITMHFLKPYFDTLDAVAGFNYSSLNVDKEQRAIMFLGSNNRQHFFFHYTHLYNNGLPFWKREKINFNFNGDFKQCLGFSATDRFCFPDEMIRFYFCRHQSVIPAIAPPPLPKPTAIPVPVCTCSDPNKVDKVWKAAMETAFTLAKRICDINPSSNAEKVVVYDRALLHIDGLRKQGFKGDYLKPAFIYLSEATDNRAEFCAADAREKKIYDNLDYAINLCQGLAFAGKGALLTLVTIVLTDVGGPQLATKFWVNYSIAKGFNFVELLADGLDPGDALKGLLIAPPNPDERDQSSIDYAFSATQDYINIAVLTAVTLMSLQPTKNPTLIKGLAQTIQKSKFMNIALKAMLGVMSGSSALGAFEAHKQTLRDLDNYHATNNGEYLFRAVLHSLLADVNVGFAGAGIGGLAESLKPKNEACLTGAPVTKEAPIDKTPKVEAKTCPSGGSNEPLVVTVKKNGDPSLSSESKANFLSSNEEPTEIIDPPEGASPNLLVEVEKPKPSVAQGGEARAEGLQLTLSESPIPENVVVRRINEQGITEYVFPTKRPGISIPAEFSQPGDLVVLIHGAPNKYTFTINRYELIPNEVVNIKITGTGQIIPNQRVARIVNVEVFTAELAQVIVDHPGFCAGKRIVLASCESGLGGRNFSALAQQLADQISLLSTSAEIKILAPKTVISSNSVTGEIENVFMVDNKIVRESVFDINFWQEFKSFAGFKELPDTTPSRSGAFQFNGFNAATEISRSRVPAAEPPAVVGPEHIIVDIGPDGQAIPQPPVPPGGFKGPAEVVPVEVEFAKPGEAVPVDPLEGFPQPANPPVSGSETQLPGPLQNPTPSDF